MNRILFPLCGAREVQIAAETIGYGEVRLEDASEHFLVELFLEGLRRTQDRIGIRILGVKISENVGIVFVA